ncbi:MAG TPA: hypothetical protein VFP80_12965 [Thermoanaerobaculia bacterium]|nr:hypothetical protein [Thermoanaerobaculia bacterium]
MPRPYIWIDKITEDRVIEIPRSAWGEIERIMVEEFGVEISIKELDAGKHEDYLLLFPCYWIEIPFDRCEILKYFTKEFRAEIKADLIDEFEERVRPLIDALIKKYRRARPEQPTTE